MSSSIANQPSAQPSAQPSIKVTPRGLSISKLSLRSLSCVLSLFIVVVCAIFANLPGVLIILLPASCITILWNIISFIYLFSTRRSDTHPGVRVASDLITWIGWSAVAVLMSSVWSVLASWTITGPSGSSHTYIYKQNLPIVKGVVVVSIFQTFIHAALFIIACCETHIRNRTRHIMARVDQKQDAADQ
ncbi:hypothetical protein CDD81_6821 [Ophiocordyceps australis]|uniref:MARVEL domain-containing protein n=1 Tax=Ophiocordyceps australis TaxID=1399860 RepID=A0A2C5XZJ7_9HYPO|nr:hypothetical protein CDD81_6821 [Ophiocordyceps australis]